MSLQDALKEAYMRAQLLKEPCYVLQKSDCATFYTVPQKELVGTDTPYIKVFSAGFYEIVNQGLVHGGFNSQRNTNSDAIGGNSHPPVSVATIEPEQRKPDTRQNIVKIRYDAFTGLAY